MAKQDSTVEQIRRIRSIYISNYREAAYAIQEAAALADRAFQVAFPAVVLEGEKVDREKAKEALKRKAELAEEAKKAEEVINEIVEGGEKEEPVDEKAEKAKSTRRRVAKIKEAMDGVSSVSEKKIVSGEEGEAGIPEEPTPTAFEKTE